MPFDSAYNAITEEHSQGDSSRWAFGTGFDDPLAGVATEVPQHVDRADLAAYCLLLGDDALVFSQRLSEWVTHAPELEEEVALANIALDLLGQARLLLSRAGQAEGRGRGEDALAYFRDAAEFGNVRLVEQPNGDFAATIARLLAFATWRLAAYSRLADSADPVLAAVAAKGVRELAYHRDYAARWVVRLGDGTAYSRGRIAAGLATVWPYVAELCVGADVERRMAAAGIGVDPAELTAECDQVFGQVLDAATLGVPEVPNTTQVPARGEHTEHLSSLLAELQTLARAHPEATW